MKNREILFRAFDSVNKRMLNNVSIGTIQIYDGEFSALAKDCIFMQFTGLIDKNGTKIFEGDICRDRMGDFIVRWDIENARFLGFYSDSVERDTGICYVGREPAVEVIGTIHDHLLKGG